MAMTLRKGKKRAKIERRINLRLKLQLAYAQRFNGRPFPGVWRARRSLSKRPGFI